jgi:hypothetical protein
MRLMRAAEFQMESAPGAYVTVAEIEEDFPSRPAGQREVGIAFGPSGDQLGHHMTYTRDFPAVSMRWVAAEMLQLWSLFINGAVFTARTVQPDGTHRDFHCYVVVSTPLGTPPAVPFEADFSVSWAVPPGR